MGIINPELVYNIVWANALVIIALIIGICTARK